MSNNGRDSDSGRGMSNNGRDCDSGRDSDSDDNLFDEKDDGSEQSSNQRESNRNLDEKNPNHRQRVNPRAKQIGQNGDVDQRAACLFVAGFDGYVRARPSAFQQHYSAF